MNLSEFEQRIAGGGRLTADEALELYRNAPTYWLGRMADGVRRRKHRPAVARGNCIHELLVLIE